MERKSRLQQRLTRCLRGDLEDSILYVMLSLPMSLFALWYGVDMYKFVHAHQIVYSAAEAAAISGATQVNYSPGTSIGGSGFSPTVNQDMAVYIANQTFEQEQNSLNLNEVVDIQSTNVVFPSSTQVAYTVTVSYTPKGMFAALDILDTFFSHGQITWSPPALTWTITPTSDISGKTV
ncbi:hypothetical protein LLE49_22190 [Alicyclobacillus tolerans]|uniref:hypothetical protein n=1 Tax=Alicyclobacillus tolerans TaxID=90970 RepID=UPI001F37F986|nr:hypothetical protein [Alicyclobacillus tolerans]MCF8567432.1 hypothetical protein [Alicyclobacillus tolerans]